MSGEASALQHLLDAERAWAAAVEGAQRDADARLRAVEAEIAAAATEAAARREADTAALVARLDAERDARARALQAAADADTARYDTVDAATVDALGRDVVRWLLEAGP